MEPLRTFIVSSVQRAERTPYDHDPYRPWDRPGAHSLPPAPDKPKKPAKRPPKVSHTPMAGRANTELVTTPEGKLRWRLSSALVAEIEHRLASGERVHAIATAMGISESPIRRVANGLRHRVGSASSDDARTLPTHKRTQTPVMVALPEGLSAPSALAVAARFAFEVRTLPVRISRSQTISTEPRTTMHVLDWQRRMSSYEFTEAPAGCLPRKPRKRVTGLSRGQMRDELRGHTRLLGMSINCHAINCAAPTSKRPPSPFV